MLQRLLVEIGAGPDSDLEELAQLCDGLRLELLELEVETVNAIGGGPAPARAKSSAVDTVGTLVVALSNSAVVVALVGVLRAWVRRGAGRKVTLRLGENSIEVSQASAEQQAILIKSWLDRHDPK
jgi:Effector Associated Constant Component 1